MSGFPLSRSKRGGFLIAIAILFAVSLSACDWNQLGYGPAHTGFSSDTSISKAALMSGSLRLDWRAITGDVIVSSPAVAKGVVYVGSNDNLLYAFDARGAIGCSGTPKRCLPLWTANVGGGDVLSSPAVANGMVYIASLAKILFAFDAAGIRGCSGTPKHCNPLWTAGLGGDVETSPAVADGRVYIIAHAGFAEKIFAFDAAVGTPLWTATVAEDQGQFQHTHSSPTVANGILYAGFTGNYCCSPPDIYQARVVAFDATGNVGCSTDGPPDICQPLWSTDISDYIDDYRSQMGTPSVSNGVMYVYGPGGLYAFDAGGISKCAGTPKMCKPLWSTGGASAALDSPAAPGDILMADSPAPPVGNGVVFYAGAAYDAAGSRNCSGIPKICQPLWTAGVGAGSSVANGIAYSGSTDGKLYGFDTNGKTNCSGTPTTCAPLWTGVAGGAALYSTPAVSNGGVYVGSTDHKLYAFRLDE